MLVSKHPFLLYLLTGYVLSAASGTLSAQDADPVDRTRHAIDWSLAPSHTVLGEPDSSFLYSHSRHRDGCRNTTAAVEPRPGLRPFGIDEGRVEDWLPAASGSFGYG